MSKFWKDGTVFAAAMTPVVVSIVKELLERPMKSDAVRRTASRVTAVAGGTLSGAASRTEDVRRGSATTSAPPPPAANGNGSGEVTPGDVVLSHPRRTYSTGGGQGLGSRFRRVHLKLAVVTGLLAFLIAAAVLTLPELVFGGAVGSKDRTTIFGGDGKSSSSDKSEKSDDESGTEPGQPQLNPQAPSDEDQSEPAPEDEDSSPTPAPSEPAPDTEAPAPSGGTPVPAPATP